MRSIGHDHRALTIDGNRQLLISGAIHYPRSTPDMWPDLLRRSKEAGLNTIETYVFWNLHERQRGVYDFSGRLDLRRFCQVVREHGLNLILRIGPYICAEINYGGLPAWLREVPDIRIRTLNQPFMQEMERWVRHLTTMLDGLYAPQGGPIIATQIENEYNLVGSSYGEEGRQYLQWAADLGNSLNLGVPWVMCVGGAQGAIETINGFNGHEQLEPHWNEHPDQPALWTENWPGWYDVWGTPHHRRSTENVAYVVTRFIAAGGTGFNYYMWHGGTNFGREAMFLQTTSYDYDAPLDEYGLPTTKSRHVTRLHAVLNEYGPLLLEHDRPTPAMLGPQQPAYAYGPLAFLCNDDPEAGAAVTWNGRTYPLPAQSVTIVDGDRVRFVTSQIEPESRVAAGFEPITGALGRFVWRAEPLPLHWPAELRFPYAAPAPINQLDLTHDITDYCWYSTAFSSGGGEGTLTLKGAGDLVYVYVDGKLAATSPTPMVEARGPLDGESFVHHFALKLAPGRHDLTLLCCGLGLVKGDWQLGMTNMAEERKGLWGQALWNGQPLPGPWQMQPGLSGEQAGLYNAAGALVAWKADPADGAGQPLRWWRTTFDMPRGGGPLALDLGSMGKGLIWVNGLCLGRYWLIPGTAPTEPWIQPPVLDDRPGEPTQRYYHVPAAWLRERANTLVLFEESGGDPAGIRLCRRTHASQ